MMAARRKRLGWLVALAAVAAAGGGIWYAQAHGRLVPAYAWVREHLSTGQKGESGDGAMSMNMPGMDTASASQGGSPSGVPGQAEVTVPGEIQQRIGVTLGQVEQAPLRMSVRTVGIVRPNETQLARIHLKTEGWVEKLFVNFTGQKVKKGDPLLALYSPQFLTTQQEYLNALQSGQDALAELSRQRLELWDVPPETMQELEKTKKPQKNLTLQSPLTGTVLEKNVQADEYVTPEKELYMLANLSSVWVQAKVYEYELPHVELGQPVTVGVPALSDRQLTGKVVFIQPTVEEPTRTVQVRIELANPDGLLKPGMFANVVIQHTMGQGLLAPTSAIIRTGERDIAFRVESEGRFMPVEVKISPYKFGDRFQILEGLKAGDQLVTSANFLIDSESRLRFGGAGGMPGMPGMDMGSQKGKDQGKKESMQGMPGMDMGGQKSKGQDKKEGMEDMPGMDMGDQKHKGQDKREGMEDMPGMEHPDTRTKALTPGKEKP